MLISTHRDLKAMVRDRQFREDLFFRLNVLPVEIPPLRERREDIRPLADQILHQVASRQGVQVPELAEDVLRALEAYDWPGNVRELENVLERATAFLEGNRIRLADLPGELRGEQTVSMSTSLAGLPLSEIEKSAILQTLELCGGNKSRAARTLGISEKSIYNKMKRFRLS